MISRVIHYPLEELEEVALGVLFVEKHQEANVGLGMLFSGRFHPGPIGDQEKGHNDAMHRLRGKHA
ncbi:hypothetical protein ACLOJK_018837 [Asimina triloba]